MLTKTGLDLLQKVQENGTAQKIISSGLYVVKQVDEQGGVEAVINKSKDKIEEFKNDKAKRKEFINSIKDTAVNFLLQV